MVYCEFLAKKKKKKNCCDKKIIFLFLFFFLISFCLDSCGDGRGESNFNSNGIERYKDEEIKTSFSSDSSFINGLKQGDDEDYNMLEQNGLMSINCSSTTNTPTCQGLFPLDSTLYGYPHQQQQQQQPPHAHSLFNATHPHPQPVSAALHFANNTPFWNAPSAATSTHIPQGIASLLEQKSAKVNSLLLIINHPYVV